MPADGENYGEYPLGRYLQERPDEQRLVTALLEYRRTTSLYLLGRNQYRRRGNWTAIFRIKVGVPEMC